MPRGTTALLLGWISIVPAVVSAAPYDTLLVSRASGIAGAKGNGSSYTPSVSGDGRYIAFASSATNLHADDSDALDDVFVRDRVTHETLLVSRATGVAGAKGDDLSTPPSMSAGGRRVAFVSAATNLHPDDDDGLNDVFVRDLDTHETILVSRASGVAGEKGNGASSTFILGISADGGRVAFASSSTNLHPDDDDSLFDVFVRDLQTHETFLASRASGVAGAKGDADCASFLIGLSADGRHVAFSSSATNLHPDDDDGLLDLFVRDLQTHETTLVSRANGADGAKADGHSNVPVISGDGRYVVYNSEATNLDPDDPDAVLDVYRRGLLDNETTLISRASGADGEKGNDETGVWSISARGLHSSLNSSATNLHPDDPDGINDVYLRDERTQETILVSRASGSAGAKGNGDSVFSSVSADARFVAFDSVASNLHPDDPDTSSDVFVRDVLGLFEDGFESGDTSAWDQTVG